MITVTYDAMNGQAFADGKCDAQVKHMISIHNAGYSQQLTFSTCNLLNALRVAVRKGEISTSDVVIMFNGEALTLYADGGIESWPVGFCDYTEKWLMQLF